MPPNNMDEFYKPNLEGKHKLQKNHTQCDITFTRLKLPLAMHIDVIKCRYLF